MKTKQQKQQEALIRKRESFQYHLNKLVEFLNQSHVSPWDPITADQVYWQDDNKEYLLNTLDKIIRLAKEGGFDILVGQEQTPFKLTRYTAAQLFKYMGDSKHNYRRLITGMKTFK